MRVTTCILRVVHTKTKVQRSQSITRDIVNLALQERAKGIIHRETAGISIGNIHSGSQHRNSNLASLLYTHGV